MHITFLGTRGGIKIRSSAHYMHSSLRITFKNTSIIIDWGEDWLDKPFPQADALFITHAHSDHVGGLAQGCPYPVFASFETWNALKQYPIKERIAILPRQIIVIGDLSVEPFFVFHSLKAPALGYKISDNKKTLFYISDVVSIKDEKEALTGVDLYIGDGALISRTLLVRKKNNILVGHAPIIEQLQWCQQYNIPQAIFTHCGSEIVRLNVLIAEEKIKQLGEIYKTHVTIAHDQMTVNLI